MRPVVFAVLIRYNRHFRHIWTPGKTNAIEYVEKPMPESREVVITEKQWAALKSAWRRTAPMVCPNCNEPTILTNFGLPQCGFCNREARFIHACGQCQRRFQDYSIDRFEVMTWMVSNLDAEVLPDFILWMGKPVKW
jgi:hypothetical protein